MSSVLVGMSGGVDSSVAALMLLRQGYDVAGCSILMREMSEGCGSRKDIEDAKRVCDILSIEHHVYDASELFRHQVVDYFAEEYRRARTPSPCVRCNREVKFASLINAADTLGIEYIATGHYAGKTVINGRQMLLRTSSPKDQSYMLCMLRREQIERVLFPIYCDDKEEIRRIAKDAGLPVFAKPDSQDICFIEDGKYTEFLEEYGIRGQDGSIVTESGEPVGRHSGLHNYTIGQRKGLGGGFAKPMFVTQLDAQKNQVVIGTHEELFRHSLICSGAVLGGDITQAANLQVQIRYRAAPAAARCEVLGDDRLRIEFECAQRAITPGQIAAFYDGNVVLGGGYIECAE